MLFTIISLHHLLLQYLLESLVPSKKAKKDKDGSAATNHTNNSCGGRDSDRGRCPIQGHDEMRHDWCGCHQNLYSRRYDAKANQEFYNNEAYGPGV